VAAAGDVLAEITLGVRLLDGFPHDEKLAHHLAADVEVGVVTADRDRADDAAFDELVRIPVEELAVLAGAGLRLIAVDDEMAGLGVVGVEAPLRARAEAGAAAATEVRFLPLVDDLGGLHADRLLQRGVAAALLEGRDLLLGLVAEVLREELGREVGGHQSTCSERGLFRRSSSTRSTFSGVRSR